MKRTSGQDPEGAAIADAAGRRNVPFGMTVIVVIVVGAMILIHHQRQHTQDDLKAQVLTALRSRLPELSVPMWDDAIASQINRRMQTGDTVPHGWQCLGVPADALTDVSKNVRWALKHSILLEQTVGPYRDEKLGTRTQTCVVAGHVEAEPNVTIGNDNTGYHYLSVKVARIDDISIDVFQQTTYRDKRLGGWIRVWFPATMSNSQATSFLFTPTFRFYRLTSRAKLNSRRPFSTTERW